VTLGHCDDIAEDVPFTLEILSRGVFIAFDNLGREPAIAEPSLTAICADAIPKYIEAGYLDRLLLSQDICWKTMLKAYGGVGYTFIQDSFLPRLTTLGVTREQIDAIMVGNPARAHTFVAPIA
jgi:phosphotriesterase-related protein